MNNFFVKNKVLVYIFFVILSFNFACSEYQKVLKSEDLNYKYDKGVEYFEKEDYVRAYPIFEELFAKVKGTKRSEDLYYYFTYCQYQLDELYVAAYHFKNFSKTFPNNSRAEESMFLSAYCHYLSSPKSSLDQTSTYKAIEELQLFANMYPKSALIDSCNTLVDELWQKLETKSYENAKLYYKMEEFQSAIVAFKNVLKDFPSTNYKEDILYYIVNSAYLLAENSIQDKKEERYNAALKEYYNFIKFKKESKYSKSVESIYTNINKKLEKLK